MIIFAAVNAIVKLRTRKGKKILCAISPDTGKVLGEISSNATWVKAGDEIECEVHEYSTYEDGERTGTTIKQVPVIKDIAYVKCQMCKVTH